MNKIFWSPSVGTDHYKIEHSTASTGTFSLLTSVNHTVPGANYDEILAAFFYLDTSGVSGRWYRITPVDSLGTEGTVSDPFQVGSSYVASLTTIAKVKEYLGLTSTTDDALLSRLIAGASRWFGSKTGCDIARTYYVDTSDGNGGSIVFLKNTPASQVDSVYIDDVLVDQRTSATGSGWVSNEYSVALSDDLTFTAGVQNVRIVYVAGHDPVPEDIEQAIIELVALKYRERTHVGTAGNSMAGTSVSFLPSIVPSSIMDVVNSYRRVQA